MKEMSKARAKRARIPKRLGPYFQEYDFRQLDIEKSANLIIQRTLEFGTWQELGWLFRVYGKARIRKFLRELGERGLSRAAFNYWRKLLGVKQWRRSPFSITRQEVWPYS